MKLTAEGVSDDTLVMMFASVLKGGALVWFTNFRNSQKSKRKVPALQDYFNDFMVRYSDGVAQKMAEQKLNALV